eukprot:TRINITY_DN154_c0_g1_i1.p1 TRINITY_DN154_c0_g1~~TRINITY_DN154_c0_g1_i1.p1  ORF type:complete len:460 (-),score=71.21 TRINITY_DN154_c0_g1_i1:59-1438(-)
MGSTTKSGCGCCGIRFRRALILPFVMWCLLAIVRGSLSTVLAAIQRGNTGKTLPSITLNASRLVISTFTLSVIVSCYACYSPHFRKRFRELCTWKNFFKLAFIGGFQHFLPFTLYAEGLRQLSPSIGSLYYAAVPFLTLIIQKLIMWRDTSLTKLQLFAIFFAFSGLVIGSLCHVAVSGAQTQPLTIASYFFFFSAATLWAVAGAFWKKFGGGIHFLFATWAQSCFATTYAWIAASIVDYNFGPPPFPPHWSYFGQSFREPHLWVGLLWTALLDGTGASIIHFYLYATVGPVLTTGTLCLVPPISSIEENAYLHEWAGKPALYISLLILGQVLLVFGLILELKAEGFTVAEIESSDDSLRAIAHTDSDDADLFEEPVIPGLYMHDEEEPDDAPLPQTVLHIQTDEPHVDAVSLPGETTALIRARSTSNFSQSSFSGLRQRSASHHSHGITASFTSMNPY